MIRPPPGLPCVLPPYRVIRWLVLRHVDGRETGRWQKSRDGAEWVDVPADDYAGWVSR